MHLTNAAQQGGVVCQVGDVKDNACHMFNYMKATMLSASSGHTHGVLMMISSPPHFTDGTGAQRYGENQPEEKQLGHGMCASPT